MRFRFIANACGIFTGVDGTQLLMDPWLDDGVFEGSWCHFPPLATTHQDLQEVGAIYLSHIHPDHYDERFFQYRKDIPIFVLESAYNFLAKNLERSGYTNVVKCPSGESVDFREFTLTLFEPFSKHQFYESNVGNLIDSALVITDRSRVTAFNANDNTPNPEACRLLKDRFGKIDLAMINYNAAGPYPSCFQNLSTEEKKSEHERILERNVNHVLSCCDALKPSAILPFAGAYVIGGKHWEKNQYLGTTTWDDCAKRIRDASDHHVITMREGDELNLKTLTLDNPYVPIDLVEQQAYIKNTLSQISYPYENDLEPSFEALEEAMMESVKCLRERAKRYGIAVKSRIRIGIDGESFWLVNGGDPEFGVSLDFVIDPKLLHRVLMRRAHWNNAEIGCHIQIWRSPNIYEPDAHTLMQFLHI